jgi:hypothetical protein
MSFFRKNTVKFFAQLFTNGARCITIKKKEFFSMEGRAFELKAKRGGIVTIRVIPGHFATKHSHVNHCVDMTRVKSEYRMAKEAARLFAESYYSTPIDTVITLERMKMVGAFLAEDLSRSGINLNQDIAVITPEITENKMLLRDNFLPNRRRCRKLERSRRPRREVVRHRRYPGLHFLCTCRLSPLPCRGEGRRPCQLLRLQSYYLMFDYPYLHVIHWWHSELPECHQSVSR